MAMVKTPIEIDEDALATAAEVLGTKTKKNRSTRRSGRLVSGWSACAPWPGSARWPTG